MGKADIILLLVAAIISVFLAFAAIYLLTQPVCFGPLLDVEA